MPTRIEWAEETWNPVTGCTPISPGCANCYAQRMANRLAGRFGYPAENPFHVTLHPDKLKDPLKWKKPRQVFMCSMGDLFHEDVPDAFITDVFDQMYRAKHHTYLLLTKRSERMRWFFQANGPLIGKDPEPNIWLGVTAENQEQADKRIPVLLQTPAAVRFVSVEPMLGPIILSSQYYDYLQGWNVYPEHDPSCDGSCSAGRCPVPVQYETEKLDWVICGGETGPGARPMHPDWARSLRDQCKAAGVSFFFKQWGEWYPDKKGIYERGDSAIFGNTVVHRVGKKAAGRLLDGREWNEMPEVE